MKQLAVAGLAGATGVGAAKLIGRAYELGGAVTKFIANRFADGAVSAASQELKKGKVTIKDLAFDVVAGGLTGGGRSRKSR